MLKRVTSQDMLDFVSTAISDKVSLLATDSGRATPITLATSRTKMVDHHRKQYVVGAVHTNTIEGFWSIFKRGVVGTFHKSQRQIYAAVRRGVSVPIQQPEQPRYVWNSDSRLLRRGHWSPSQLKRQRASKPKEEQLELPFGLPLSPIFAPNKDRKRGKGQPFSRKVIIEPRNGRSRNHSRWILVHLLGLDLSTRHFCSRAHCACCRVFVASRWAKPHREALDHARETKLETIQPDAEKDRLARSEVGGRNYCRVGTCLEMCL